MLGFGKLGQKYLDHYTEEMEWVEKYANRMLDLGCVPQVKFSQECKLIEDPVEDIKADLNLGHSTSGWLSAAVLKTCLFFGGANKRWYSALVLFL